MVNSVCAVYAYPGGFRSLVLNQVTVVLVCVGVRREKGELTFRRGMVPADLRERPDERQLGHVGGAAVAVVVAALLGALVLMPANGNQPVH